MQPISSLGTVISWVCCEDCGRFWWPARAAKAERHQNELGKGNIFLHFLRPQEKTTNKANLALIEIRSDDKGGRIRATWVTGGGGYSAVGLVYYWLTARGASAIRYWKGISFSSEIENHISFLSIFFSLSRGGSLSSSLAIGIRDDDIPVRLCSLHFSIENDLRQFDQQKKREERKFGNLKAARENSLLLFAFAFSCTHWSGFLL